MQLSHGYILFTSQTGPINIKQRVRLRVRTRTPNAVLVRFGGGRASLELQHGSVVYRREIDPARQSHSAITLEAHAHISDGRWHDIELMARPFARVGGCFGGVV